MTFYLDPSQIAAGKAPKAAAWPALFGAMAEHDVAQRVLLTQPVLAFEELVAGHGPSAAINSAKFAGVRVNSLASGAPASPGA